jgi:hypothetical protein
LKTPLSLSSSEARATRVLGRRVNWSALGYIALNLFATIQVVWFYVNRVPPHIQLLAYEQGRERTPFQYRVLMMWPMSWAHSSPVIIRCAHALNAMPGWFPNGVRPEGVVQAPIDLASVIVAGLVARRLYLGASRSGLLTPIVYPLTLVMVASTYCLLNMHLLRFIYDLPSLALFSIGLELIYFRRSHLLFALLFIVATLNRETSLFLLAFFAVAECFRNGGEVRLSYSARVLRVLVPLSAFWLAWHAYIAHRYAANPTESLARVYLNVGLLLLPLTWPQMFAAFAYLWPFVLVSRDRISDDVLRAWWWVLPAWFAFMFYYGIFIETRVFGELIPYFACTVTLVCEAAILRRTASYLGCEH